MPFSFVAIYALFGCAVLLALAVIPLAARHAGSVAWWSHALLTVLVIGALTILLHRWVYHAMIPWWRIGTFYAAVAGMPIILGGWLARIAVESRPTQAWTVSTAVGIGMLVLVGVGADRLGRHVLPAIITAVQ